ncbi:type II toxin-antitoxin system Phd/YefM family antitoxin [Synechocystis salina]|uniref:Antitoxin n=1 Tax=Synechocystis salina LEGE 00031 TaxID=1828736 RepID=A0ABR9VVX4_9SYNC|nr:type II toxin-antitoxin system Phd/YefM family antitoxin [Synechocystis salina]MBE9242414.1 type II toxin-antitoxin system Phd/YefM family antitoxin [Synechocystis salina LEGE 00041]MBE9255509.1 type II toxin-antitoxin system Phd/YefM family antitoxin [Synechocystis salina LEGE 00031]
MKAITTTQAKDSLDELINSVISDLEPTIVSNNQGQQVVLISLDEFNSWQETLYLLSNPANVEHLMASIKQAKTGQIVEPKSPDLFEL